MVSEGIEITNSPHIEMGPMGIPELLQKFVDFEKDHLKKQIIERAASSMHLAYKKIMPIAQNVMSIKGLGPVINMDSIDAISDVISEADESYFIIYVNGAKIKITEEDESDTIALRMAVVDLWKKYCHFKNEKELGGDDIAEEAPIQ